MKLPPNVSFGAALHAPPRMAQIGMRVMPSIWYSSALESLARLVPGRSTSSINCGIAAAPLRTMEGR
jgi:hypothetical protein